MENKGFAPRCVDCRQKTMALAIVPFDIRIEHDGKKYEVHVPELSVPKCSNCGAMTVDEVASEQIDDAFRAQAKLLTPAQIRKLREDGGFSQQDFARCLGISPSTLSRWENGVQVQQSFHDGILRAFREIPELRAFLAKWHGMSSA